MQKMELKEIKESFYNYLKHFNENEILILMNYLSFLLIDFNSNYSNFITYLNKELNLPHLNNLKSWANSIDDDLFEIETVSTESCDYDNKKTVTEDESDKAEDKINTNQTNAKNDSMLGEDIMETDSESQLSESDTSSREESFNKNNKNNLFSKTNLKYLRSQYALNKYPTPDEINKICEKTSMTYQSVYTWFCHTRSRSNESKSQKFPNSVVEILEEEYAKNKFPSGKTKEKLMEKTKLSYKQIMFWFCKRRRKSDSNQTRNNSNSKRPFEPKQIEFLVRKYEEDKNPSREDLEIIAAKLKADYLKVYNWFLNRRSKHGHSRSKSYSKEQLEILNREYEKNHYPSGADKKRIASLAGLTPNQVNCWFNSQKWGNN